MTLTETNQPTERDSNTIRVRRVREGKKKQGSVYLRLASARLLWTGSTQTSRSSGCGSASGIGPTF